jgi:membrane-bound metal-dependent hydrolase YbcI (DUF457 family)
MFIGHFAVGMAGKRVAPGPSLAWWIVAPNFLDLLWPIFLVLGWESVRIEPGNTVFTPLDLHDYPWSHSLVMSLAWSAVFAAAYLWRHRQDRGGALWLGLGAFSHFILDFVTHRADIPLWPGSMTRVGLGLWNSRPGTMAIEITMFVVAVLLYARGTRARDRGGSVAWWALVGLLAIMYLGVAFGPPPPSVTAIKVMGLVAWLFAAWGAYIERHRTPRPAV